MASNVSQPSSAAHAADPTDGPPSTPAWYIPDEDLPELDPKAKELFVQYSHLSPGQVREHVLRNRQAAWKVFPFPCIGQMRFLDFSLANMPAYDQIVAQLKDGSSSTCLLDVGCCFGQDLRRLVFDGVQSQKLVGLELKPQFISLGFDLFADRESYKGQMVAGDIFDDSSIGPVAKLRGAIDIAHAASFFHLFDWETQRKAGISLVAMMRDAPGTLILGRHLGSSIGEERPNPTNPQAKMYFHSPETFEKLWKEISEQTGTRWDVHAWLEETLTHSTASTKKQWLNNQIQLVYFEIRRKNKE